MPAPLAKPAEFCMASCRRKTNCRMGIPQDADRAKLFKTALERCTETCFEWMKAHPFEAAAQRRCYGLKQCGRLLNCLTEVDRLVKNAADPEKQKQCLGLCVDVGQCDGPERGCMALCRNEDIRVYRALDECENRSCPRIKDCFIEHMRARGAFIHTYSRKLTE